MLKKRISLKTPALIICSLALLIASCKKKEIQGPQGDPGTPGIGGNVSVTTSTIITVNTSQWQVDNAANYLKATIDFPQITEAVINRGAVKAYIQTGTSLAGAIWAELPYVTGDLFTQFGFDVGHLYITFLNIEGGMPSAPPTTNYRVVIMSEVQ